MKFAKDTDVSVAKSRAEIEQTVSRYGANGFMSGWQGDRAMVAFEMRDRRIKFLLPLPARTDKQFQRTPARGYTRTPEQAAEAWEQACRQKWRALALAIKAKLEAVESGISTFEEEFMSFIVLPTGLTIGETMIPKLSEILATGNMPPLLPGPGQSTTH